MSIDDGVDIGEMDGLIDGLIAGCECNCKKQDGGDEMTGEVNKDINDRTSLYHFDEKSDYHNKTFKELVEGCGYSCKDRCEDPTFSCTLKSLNALGLFPSFD